MGQADAHRAGPNYSLLLGSRERPLTQVFIVNGLVGRGGKRTVKSVSLATKITNTLKSGIQIVGQ